MEGTNIYRRSEIGDTGRTFEYQMLGEVDVSSPEYEKLLKKLSDKDRPGYIGRRQALQLVKESQPGDPENPDRLFLKDLLLEIQDRLEKAGTTAEVRAYTAVGTPLDHLHGIDAFITAVTEDGKEHLCTIDVTLDRDKLKSGHKADLIVGKLPDPTSCERQEDDYLKRIERIADQAIAKLNKTMQKDQGMTETRRRLFGSDQPEKRVDL
ncbi:MAG: hypothetical protein ABIJ46_03425 [bacterium]